MSVTVGEERVEEGVRRVLVYRLGSLGDTVVALPCFHLIARVFPRAERRLLTNVPVASRAPAAAAVLGESGLIHSYEPYLLGLRKPVRLLRLLLRLRRFRPEVIVYLKSTPNAATLRRDRIFLRLVGAPRIACLPEDAAVYADLVMEDGLLEPEAARLARTVSALGDARVEDAASWDLRLSATEMASADAALEPMGEVPYFAVSVGTKVQVKDWGVENWRSLLQALAGAYPGYGLLLSGAPEEQAVSEAAAAGWRAVAGAGPVVNVCGRLFPRESAAAYRRAVVFVGHDSGPMHLAAAVRVPVVALFSARNKPRTWFPMCPEQAVLYHRVDCWGCELEVCVEQKKKCLLSITVQEVVGAVMGLVGPAMRVTNKKAEVHDVA